MTVIQFEPRKGPMGKPLVPEPMERLTGCLTWLTTEIEAMLPMTGTQRSRLAVLIEQVLDTMEDQLGPPKPGA